MRACLPLLACLLLCFTATGCGSAESKPDEEPPALEESETPDPVKTYIVSEPEGAILSINGEAIGATPVSIELPVDKTSLELRLERDGYWTYVEELKRPDLGWPTALGYRLQKRAR